MRDVGSGKERREPYDKLLLAPGAAPVRPPLPGVDLPGVFGLRTIPDAHHMRSFIEARAPEHAVVVGGGFTGLEVRRASHHPSPPPPLPLSPHLCLPLPPRSPRISTPAGCT